MTDSIWDTQFDLGSGSDFVKFEEIGDSVVGTITEIGAHTFPADGDKPARRVPKLSLTTEDGEERTLTAGQTHLGRQLAEKRPAVGDKLSVSYVGDKGRMKVFKVEVTAGQSGPGF
jgi:hypothetical protein